MAERNPSCEEWESLIPEAMDGTLAAADLASFEQHGRECAACARMLEEARQGALWLGFLEDQPEPPAGLMQKILSQTSGAAGSFLSGQATGAGFSAAQGSLAATRPPVWQGAAPPTPHILMTAAMAFFSLALVLNLTGVNFSKIDLSGFTPSALRTLLMRQYYSANAQVVKYYENLPFVYEMEARIRDLQRSSGSQPDPEAAPEPPTHSPALHSPVSWNDGTRPGQKNIGPFGPEIRHARGKRSLA